jgi:predicted O-methyltransferase YrrM
MVERALAGIPRAMRLGGGSLSELIRLVDAQLHVRRYVEVGSYEGGSILALGLRFLHRDIDFYAVESFTGNLDGTVDGHALPSRRRFVEHVKRFPGLRVRLVPGDSVRAAALFDDGSVDFVFIDARHDTASVLADIDAWLPKMSSRGVIAGDDYGFPTVRAAVDARFPDVHITVSGFVWWQRIAR